MMLQAQNLIQRLNTPIPTMFPEGRGLSQNKSEDSVMELSQNLFGVDCSRVD